jgi:2-(1,2-epoxy-1,2-dihydrophenyl)acetyl-CoA isomerase
MSRILTSFDPATGIARITFNRPEVLNTIDRAMAVELLGASRSIAAQKGLRCIVLRGVGRAFMAGGDVGDFAGADAQPAERLNAILDAMNPAVLALRACDAPIVAGVHGVAAGAGLTLALMADIVVAEDQARFLLAYERIGAVPDCGGSWFLARKVGAGRAAELMLLSRTLTATEARDWGIVSEVVPADAFDGALDSMAQKLANGPSLAFAAFRRLLDGAAYQPLTAQLEEERATFLRIAATADFAEGTAAFLEKRPASFAGR